MALKLTKAHCAQIQRHANQIDHEQVAVAILERKDGDNVSFNLLQFEDDQHDLSDKFWLSQANGLDLDFGNKQFSIIECAYYEIGEFDGQVSDLIDHFDVKFERVNNKAIISEIGEYLRNE